MFKIGTCKKVQYNLGRRSPPSGNTPKKRVFLHGRTSQGQALIRLRSDKHAIECEYILGGCRLIFIIDSDFSFVKIVFHMSGLLSIVFLCFCTFVLLYYF